jgi:RimK family alpha-L-glutamate ligase
MKNITIGYIFNSKRKGIEEKKFFKVAKKMNIELVLFNLSDEIDEEEIKKKAKKCKIIFNDTAEEIAYELVKTLETLGSRVVEKSEVTYYPEDKWIFSVMCRKNKIPIPETILLPTDLESAKKELIDFDQWPVILKRVYGCRGEFVDKADNVKEAIKVIKAFWKKGNERLAILAQEFVASDSYRVTVIGNKIMQTAIKRRSGWKACGCSSERFWKFKIDNELKKIIKKVVKAFDIKICGIDFAKNKGKWVVIEVNAEPSLKLFDSEHEMMIRETLKLLIKLAKKK